MEDKLEDSVLVVWVDLSTTSSPVLALISAYGMDLRKKVLETFINKALAINASHAVRGKPPMFFAAFDKMVEEFLKNRRN